MSRGRDIFKKNKKFINVIAKVLSLFSKKKQVKMLHFCRFWKGKIGIGIRYCLLKNIAKTCGDNVLIQEGVYLLNPQNLEIGDNVSIHPMCYIECGQEGSIKIGNDVSIAHSVTILAVSHRFNERNIPIKDQGIEYGTVDIKSNTWIGAKATILKDRTIGEGAIVGANCLVTHDVNDNTIVGGIPNKVIKER